MTDSADVVGSASGGARLESPAGIAGAGDEAPARPNSVGPFRVGVRSKLVAAMLAVTVVAVAAMGVVTRIAFDRGFVNYVNEQGVERLESLQPRLAAGYAEHGSWDFLLESVTVWFDIVGYPGGHTEVPPLGSPVPVDVPVDVTGTSLRIALLDEQRRFFIGFIGVAEGAVELPIVVEGKTVGWLEYVPVKEVVTTADQRFRRQQNLLTFIIGAIVMGGAAGLALLMSNTMLRPLRRVGRAISRLASGDHAARLPVESNDEVGQLSTDVNHLAMVLDRNESLRRTLMADLSHELRTPIAILHAELEAVRDGLRTPDAESLRAWLAEVKTLGSLVNDIYELSSTDAGALSYRMQTVDLADIVDCAARAFSERRKRRNISFDYVPFTGEVEILGDDARINQLFNNLFENSVRYTDHGGTLRVACRLTASTARVVIEDSAPGVPDELLENLFHRYFRARPPRTGRRRGSGLGLAICRNIIEAHRGSIRASHSTLGGLRVEIELPRLPR